MCLSACQVLSGQTAAAFKNLLSVRVAGVVAGAASEQDAVRQLREPRSVSRRFRMDT